MRVFHEYLFLLDKETPFKEVLPKAEEFLRENGYEYEGIGFLAENFGDEGTERFCKRYPELAKYCRKDVDYGMASSHYNIRSLDMEKMTLLAPKEDEDHIRRMFSKIPHGISFGNVTGVIGNIHWFPQINRQELFPIGWPTGDKPTAGWMEGYYANVMLLCAKSIGTRYSKNHQIKIIVEVTDSKDDILDDSSILHRATECFGEPIHRYTRCAFDDEEKNSFDRELLKIYDQLISIEKDMSNQIENMPGMSSWKNFSTVGRAKQLANASAAKALDKAIKPLGLRRVPGLVYTEWIDENGHKYTVWADLTPSGRALSCGFNVDGYNFGEGQFYSTNQSILRHFILVRCYPKTQEDIENIIAGMVELILKEKPRLSEHLAAAFGKTPDWYWKVSDVIQRLK